MTEKLYCDYEYGKDSSDKWTQLLSVTVYSNLHGLVYDQLCIPSKEMVFDYKNKNLSFDRLNTQGKRFNTIQKELKYIFDNKIIIVWNANGEVIYNPALRAVQQKGYLRCAMERFSNRYGFFNKYHQNYTWISLEKAMKMVGLSYSVDGINDLVFKPHTSNADCIALMKICKWMDMNEHNFDFEKSSTKIKLISNNVLNERDSFDDVPF